MRDFCNCCYFGLLLLCSFPNSERLHVSNVHHNVGLGQIQSGSGAGYGAKRLQHVPGLERTREPKKQERGSDRLTHRNGLEQERRGVHCAKGIGASKKEQQRALKRPEYLRNRTTLFERDWSTKTLEVEKLCANCSNHTLENLGHHRWKVTSDESILGRGSNCSKGTRKFEKQCITLENDLEFQSSKGSRELRKRSRLSKGTGGEFETEARAARNGMNELRKKRKLLGRA